MCSARSFWTIHWGRVGHVLWHLQGSTNISSILEQIAPGQRSLSCFSVILWPVPTTDGHISHNGSHSLKHWLEPFFLMDFFCEGWCCGLLAGYSLAACNRCLNLVLHTYPLYFPLKHHPWMMHHYLGRYANLADHWCFWKVPFKIRKSTHSVSFIKDNVSIHNTRSMVNCIPCLTMTGWTCCSE